MKKYTIVLIIMFSFLGVLLSYQTVSAQSNYEPELVVLSAKQDLHVVLYAHNFPAFLEIQVSMGPNGAAAKDMIEITTINAGESGAFFKVIIFPTELIGTEQINIKLEGIKSEYTADTTVTNKTFVNEKATQNARANINMEEGSDEAIIPPANEAPAETVVFTDSPEPNPSVELDTSRWLENGNQDQQRIDPVLFVWPAEKLWLSGYDYSETHKAIDIAASKDDFVFAAASGKVTITSYSSTGYGNMIRIDHQNGYETLYAHFNTILVNEGDYIVQGQPIGLAGSTGYSSGPHLHFEIRYQGALLNPWDFFD